MSKRAKYNNGGPEHLELVVVKENENGTLDLATDAGVLKVTNCPQCDEPKVGHCLAFVEVEQVSDKTNEDSKSPEGKKKKAQA